MSSPEQSRAQSKRGDSDSEEEEDEDGDFDFDEMMPAVDMTAYFKKEEVEKLVKDAIQESEAKL